MMKCLKGTNKERMKNLNGKLMKILALVLMVSMLFSFAACSGKENPPADGATEPTQSTADDPVTAQKPEEPDENTQADEPVSDEQPSDITDAQQPAENETDTQVAPQPGDTTVPPTPENPTQAPKTKPETTQEILDYYAAATANAVYPKAGFQKERYSVLDGEPDIPGVLKAINADELFYKFMGIGDKNKYKKTVVKGTEEKYDFISKSKLTKDDVKSAQCKESNGNYIITIKLKDGSSSAKAGNMTDISRLSIEKSGICWGVKDKSEYDHKNAVVIYDALDNDFDAVNISEKYSNAIVTAVINAKSGRLTSLKVTFNISAKIYFKIKVIGTPIDLSLSGASTIEYSNFKY